MSVTIGFKLIERNDFPEGMSISGYKIQYFAEADPATPLATKVVQATDKVTIAGEERIGGTMDWTKKPGRYVARSVALDASGNEIDGTADYGTLVIEAPKTISLQVPSETRASVQ